MIDWGQEIGQCTIGFLACAYLGGAVMVQRNTKYVTATGPQNAANLGKALLVSRDVFENFGADHEVKGFFGIGETSNVLAFYAARSHLAEGDVRKVLRSSVRGADVPEFFVKGTVATDLEDVRCG